MVEAMTKAVESASFAAVKDLDLFIRLSWGIGRYKGSPIYR